MGRRRPTRPISDGSTAPSSTTTPDTNYIGWIGFQSPRVGGTRTVTVNGVTSTFTNSAQADWLLGALDTTKPWTIVVVHHPLLDSRSGDPYAESKQTGTITTTNQYYYGERNRLLALFAAKGVDLVLAGHVHYYRRHLEKVDLGGNPLQPAWLPFITASLGGSSPHEQQKDAADPDPPSLDYTGLNHDGMQEPNELNTAANAFYDPGHFGTINTPEDGQGYSGAADEYHDAGTEYSDGVTFGYLVLQTGTGADGQPTLTVTTKRRSWSMATHDWTPWNVYE